MGNTIIDFTKAATLTPDPLDPEKMWLKENELPESEPTEVNEPPLKTDDTVPSTHPGEPLIAPPECPKLHKYYPKEKGCGGLPGFVAERARAYQLASINDPLHWSDQYKASAYKMMRNHSAMGIYRVLAHFNYPYDSLESSNNPEKLLEELLYPDGGKEKTPLQTWDETSDFFANGIIRLLYLFADKTWRPDPNRPLNTEPLLPCRLQWECVRQLLGYKYFGD